MDCLQGEDLALEHASREACHLVLAALELLIPIWGTRSHLEDPRVPLRSRSLALAALLADVSQGHLELYDAECIAAGLLVQAVSEGRLSLKDVGLRLGHKVAHLVHDTLQVMPHGKQSLFRMLVALTTFATTSETVALTCRMPEPSSSCTYYFHSLTSLSLQGSPASAAHPAGEVCFILSPFSMNAWCFLKFQGGSHLAMAS